MWLQYSLAMVVTFLGVVILQSPASGEAEPSQDMDKRRGWGKRSFPGQNEAGLTEADLDKRRGWGKRFALDDEDEEEVDKRRGWGKRAMDKRRGWGKRGVETDSEDDLDLDKRRGWGKRSGYDLPEDALEDMDKRRGWGKRSGAAVAAYPESVRLASIASGLDKRRGWGKRAFADDAELLHMQDKRRGWGKRYGWGKRSQRSCEQLEQDVKDFVILAAEADKQRTEQCSAKGLLDL